MKQFFRNWWQNEWHEKWKRLGLHVDSTPRQINFGRAFVYALLGIIGLQWWASNKVAEEMIEHIHNLEDPDNDVDLPKQVGAHINDLLDQWRESVPHHVGAFGLASAQEHFSIEAIDEYFRNRDLHDEINAHITNKGLESAIDFYGPEAVTRAKEQR